MVVDSSSGARSSPGSYSPTYSSSLGLGATGVAAKATEAKEDDDNERVMEALWNGVGLQSAFRHDVAEGGNGNKNRKSRSQARSEARRAREFSERAQATIRTQRRRLLAAPVHQPTWTGRRGARQEDVPGAIGSRQPRFGRRTNVAFNGVTSSSAASRTDTVSQTHGVSVVDGSLARDRLPSGEAAVARSADLSARLLMSSTSLGAGGVGGRDDPSFGGTAMSSSSLLAQIRARTGGENTGQNEYVSGNGGVAAAAASPSSSIPSSFGRINPRDRLGKALAPSLRMTDDQYYRSFRAGITKLLRDRGGSATTEEILTIAPAQSNSRHTLQRSKKLMKLFKRALKKLATLHTVSGVWSEKARP